MTGKWRYAHPVGFRYEKTKKRVIPTLIVLTLFLSGCKMSPEKALTMDPETTQTQVTAGQTEAPKVDEGSAYIAQLNSQRAVAVMLDNHSGARPQAGLKDAEIVIEALAEGNITRYMAVFFGGMPELVGPIRSARPYFIDRAMEYEAVYVHIGGSPKALSDVKKLSLADLDGLSSSNKVFFRKSHKKMPHNAYSSLEILRAEASKRKFDMSPKPLDWHFNSTDQVPIGDAVNRLVMPYRKNDGGYSVSYQYDTATKRYMRYINGKAHLDEIDSSAIGAKNVIVQVVPTKVVDDVGRLDLELVGSGDAFYLSNGVKVPLTWSKANRQAQTVYKNPQGDVLSLNPGNTWIQIVPKNMALQWE